MTTDSRDTRRTERTLTIADLCEAIASGEITPKVRDGYYQIQGRDMRKLRLLYSAELAESPAIMLGAGSDSHVGCLA
jgi:hypothetical protein